VTGAAADKARAAAVKAVGGGTAGAVTTDVSGNGFEGTVTKSDGSKVEVHLDQSFNLGGSAQLLGHER
jgi:outer membrane lipoprotein SlyB